MKIDFQRSPVTKFISVQGSSLLFECTCGKPFSKFEEISPEGFRCRFCKGSSSSLKELLKTQREELFDYMYTEVLSIYRNKITKGIE